MGDVATTIGRTVHATEALLTRAKAAFRNYANQTWADHIVGQETS